MPSIRIPAFPDSEPGLRTLALIGRRTDSESYGPIHVTAADLAATMLWTGGLLTISLDQVASATVACAVGSISPVRNVFNVQKPMTLTVRVAADPGVTWNLRVEQ